MAALEKQKRLLEGILDTDFEAKKKGEQEAKPVTEAKRRWGAVKAAAAQVLLIACPSSRAAECPAPHVRNAHAVALPLCPPPLAPACCSWVR